jgi:hypothetical protein
MGRENPQTTVPPLHNGTVAHVSDQQPVLWCGIDEGIFLTSTWNSLPRGAEHRTWGVLPEPINQLS